MSGTSHRSFGSVEEYVNLLGGSKRRVIRKILIANNGIGAVKCIRSIHKFCFDSFGDDKVSERSEKAFLEDENIRAKWLHS